MISISPFVSSPSVGEGDAGRQRPEKTSGRAPRMPKMPTIQCGRGAQLAVVNGGRGRVRLGGGGRWWDSPGRWWCVFDEVRLKLATAAGWWHMDFDEWWGWPPVGFWWGRLGAFHVQSLAGQVADRGGKPDQTTQYPSRRPLVQNPKKPQKT